VSSGQDREFEAVVDFPRFIDTIRQSKKISDDNLSVSDCYWLGDFTCCAVDSSNSTFIPNRNPRSEEPLSKIC